VVYVRLVCTAGPASLTRPATVIMIVYDDDDGTQLGRMLPAMA
jgi:hypothetical protein